MSVKGDKLMNKDQFNVAHLTEKEIQQLHSLEKTLSAEKGEEVILIAYQEEQNK